MTKLCNTCNTLQMCETFGSLIRQSPGSDKPFIHLFTLNYVQSFLVYHFFNCILYQGMAFCGLSGFCTSFITVYHWIILGLSTPGDSLLRVQEFSLKQLLHLLEDHEDRLTNLNYRQVMWAKISLNCGCHVKIMTAIWIHIAQKEIFKAICSYLKSQTYNKLISPMIYPSISIF